MRAAAVLLPAGARAKKHSDLYPGAGLALAALALTIQVFLSTQAAPFSLVNLPLIVVVFLAVTRRSVAMGMLMGMGVGWAQDALTHGPLGVFGIVSTFVGYAAASISLYIEVDYPGIRSVILALSYLLHEALLFSIRSSLLGVDVSFDPVAWVVLAAVHAGVGLLLYPLFDKLRRAR